ncbi:GNAT family N-acetyltransferase [Algoriphagus aestuarii]|nr:GNAT family N-acetyltransferase [Algoriphagus aestuarii]
MTNTKKEINKGYDLLVEPSRIFPKDYLIANFPLEGTAELLDFFLLKKNRKKAYITFAIGVNNDAISLPNAPFGGFFILEKIHSESIDWFISRIQSHLKVRGIKSIEITNAPKPYEENCDLINYLLFKNGFRQENVLCHQFFIGKKKIKKWSSQEQTKYERKIADSEISTSCTAITNFSFLKSIKEWNKGRGFEVKLEENRIIQQVAEYPERYFLISLFYDDQVIAHCLAVKLFDDTIYYFLSAIDPKTTVKNVGEILLYQLFKLAAEQKVKLIDLGSSDLGKFANHPLLFFKSRFSNDNSNKITWTKMI